MPRPPRRRPRKFPPPVLDLYETKPLPPTTRAVGAPASKSKSKKDGDRKSAARSPKSSARSRAASASNAFSPDDEEAAPAPKEGNTKNLIIAAVLVLGLAASGYYAWPRLQPALESLPIVQKYFGTPQSEVSPAVSRPRPGSGFCHRAVRRPPRATSFGLGQRPHRAPDKTGTKQPGGRIGSTRAGGIGSGQLIAIRGRGRTASIDRAPCSGESFETDRGER